MLSKEVNLPLVEIYSFIYLVPLVAEYTRNAFAGGICWVGSYSIQVTQLDTQCLYPGTTEMITFH